jgi:glycogen synthase
MNKPLRILYATGPEEVIEVFKCWTAKKSSDAQLFLPYSEQFYNVCSSIGAKGYVISQAPNIEKIQNDQFIVENHPPIFPNIRSGLVYHLKQVWYGFELLIIALRFKADVVIVVDGYTHWFILSIFSWFFIKVIPSLHCVIVRKYTTPRRGEKILFELSRRFFSKDSFGILSISQDVTHQIKQLTQDKHPNILQFIPSYRKSDFENVEVPNLEKPLFRVLFSGRIVEEKGVFDILEIAKRFALERNDKVVFDICGNGPDLEILEEKVQQNKLENLVFCYGYCRKSQLRELLEASHAVIVPTKSQFVEGFNRSLLEGVLSLRPVITSPVCPAAHYVRDAAIIVPPDNVEAYGDAILNLYSNKPLYENLLRKCMETREQFFDSSNSWGVSLSKLLKTIHIPEN